MKSFVSTLTALLAVSMAVLAAPPAAGEGVPEEPALKEWTAPPYWTSAGSGRSGGRDGLASGRRPLTGAPVALPFIALAPCRIVDTRGNAPLTGGFLPPATVRSYALAGVCNLPPDAQAVSLNVTVIQPTGPGFLTIWAEGAAFPPVSTVTFFGGEVLSNAAVVALGAGGGVSMALGVSGADVVLDTNGYYAPVPGVSSLNALSGDVVLSAGSNLTLTPSGNELVVGTERTLSADVIGNVTGNVAGAASANVLKTGDTMVGTLNVNPGNINLTPSTGPTGSVLKNGAPFIHDYGTDNTFVGVNAGNFSMLGFRNAAVGAQSLQFNDFGSDNAALGVGALGFNRGGSQNVAIGAAALHGNMSGYSNVALGFVALNNNTIGTGNTATGAWALAFNTGGHNNAAHGYEALLHNSTGSNNSASGSQALTSNTSGSWNTAEGVLALGGNVAGSYNTASGAQALNTVTTGNDNTALGHIAGGFGGAATSYSGAPISFPGVSTGSSNTLVGSFAGATSDVTNCTAVGWSSYCDADNQVRLGGPSVTSIGGKVGWSALSDVRAKKDVRDLSLGLAFVIALRPVEYRLRNGNGHVDMGFVAQDVEALLGEDYNVVDAGGDADRTLSLRYTDLIAPLVKAVQEQQKVIQQLLERLARAEAGLAAAR